MAVGYSATRALPTAGATASEFGQPNRGGGFRIQVPAPRLPGRGARRAPPVELSEVALSYCDRIVNRDRVVRLNCAITATAPAMQSSGRPSGFYETSEPFPRKAHRIRKPA